MFGVIVLAEQLPQLVMLIIDGCGTNHYEAARLVEHGGNWDASIKEMDEITLLSTQNALFQLTDSAAAATAISCGVKTLNGRMGVDMNGRNVQNLLEYLRQHRPEYLTGIISKVESTHATPGSFLAHSMDRSASKDLWQSITDYAKADLIMGAGDYADGFQAQKSALKRQGYNTVSTAEYKKNRDILKKTSLPLFAAIGDKQLPYYIDYPTEYPTLSEMTMTAIQKLGFNNTPFFLMVEASLNDYGSHNNNLSQLVGEMIEADHLISQLLALRETMPLLNIIVTADHETGGLTLPDTLETLDVDTVSLPNEGFTMQENNKLRKARIDLLGVNFSTTGHTNAPVVTGFAGAQLGPLAKSLQTTSDLRPFVQRFLTGRKELTPYDGIVKNAAEGIFNERQKYYNAGNSNPDTPDEPKKHSTGGILAVGIVSGAAAAGLIVLGIYFIMKQYKKTHGYHRQQNAPLLGTEMVGNQKEQTGIAEQ